MEHVNLFLHKVGTNSVSYCSYSQY